MFPPVIFTSAPSLANRNPPLPEDLHSLKVPPATSMSLLLNASGEGEKGGANNVDEKVLRINAREHDIIIHIKVVYY